MMNKRLLYTQVALVTVGIAIALTQKGQDAAFGALYGGMIAILNTLLLSWRIKRAGTVARTDPKRGVYILYFGAVERFVFALVTLAVGLGAFKLDPLPLLITFGLAQLAYMLSGRSTR